MHKDLEHGVTITSHSLKTCFISGLGPELHEVIKDLNRNKLDPEWTPMEIKDLIQPNCDYLRLQTQLRVHCASYKTITSAEPSTSNKTPSHKNHNSDANNLPEKDRDRRHRIYNAIRNGTFKIFAFEKEVGATMCILRHYSS